MVNKLSECEYRVEMNAAEQFFCRHSKVHSRGNIVSPSVCASCCMRTEVCELPRPLPASREIPAEVNIPVTRQVWDLTRSVAAFVSDGLRLVDRTSYSERLAICDDCESRAGNRCAECGCHLTLKAAARAFNCPKGKWPDGRAVES
jgi:hypothetical protein